MRNHIAEGSPANHVERRQNGLPSCAIEGGAPRAMSRSISASDQDSEDTLDDDSLKWRRELETTVERHTRRMEYNNRMAELIITFFTLFILIELNNIPRECELEQCLNEYLTAGGESDYDFFMTDCSVLRQQCTHGPVGRLMKKGGSFRKWADLPHNTSAIVGAYSLVADFCVCLLRQHPGDFLCDFEISTCFQFILGLFFLYWLEVRCRPPDVFLLVETQVRSMELRAAGSAIDMKIRGGGRPRGNIFSRLNHCLGDRKVVMVLFGCYFLFWLLFYRFFSGCYSTGLTEKQYIISTICGCGVAATFFMVLLEAYGEWAIQRMARNKPRGKTAEQRGKQPNVMFPAIQAGEQKLPPMTAPSSSLPAILPRSAPSMAFQSPMTDTSHSVFQPSAAAPYTINVERPVGEVARADSLEEDPFSLDASLPNLQWMSGWQSRRGNNQDNGRERGRSNRQ
ncbi:unnamed protein product [Vitrella brassicaformis CCMP3155]|uniref:Uncharacterized protein n=2 Tax=Vitrella brassicaformis TaxID=1169539 RepID=A0A0G4EI21_VITBC|nr:unnamed protein product [Vitrella brassicaformis CCMP3155]|eukprot:CEL95616.1 unnamed protein product [Vitrella brassicaformis CCMP3155]